MVTGVMSRVAGHLDVCHFLFVFFYILLQKTGSAQMDERGGEMSSGMEKRTGGTRDARQFLSRCVQSSLEL